MKLFSYNSTKCLREILRLEGLLGIPDTGGRFLNYKKANARIAFLEAELAKRPATPPPVAVVPVATTKAPAAATGLPRATLLKILKAADSLAAYQVRDDWTDQEVLLETERACFQSHVRFPGMRSDQELSAEFWRKGANTITGNARYMRAQAREKIDQIISSK